MYTEGLQAKVKKLSREELEKLAVNAIYHLRCVSGSRNSFNPDWMNATYDYGRAYPMRTSQVQAMHERAVEFLNKEDV